MTSPPSTSAGGSDTAGIEFATRDRIVDLQLHRLKWSLQHAYDNVPHYRKGFDEQGFHPADLKELADIANFRFTTKATLRENYPFGMFAVPQDKVARIHASSGTTGQPTVVGYTRNDLSNWSDLMARSLRAAGVGPGDKVQVAYGYGLFTGGLGAHYGAERLGCTVIPTSGGMTERQIQVIEDFKPDAIMVTPSYLLTIIDAMIKKGIDPSMTSLRTGVLGAEPWTEQMRREIEQQLGMDALDIYGLSELMGPGVAQECVETKDGLHIWEDHFYPEVIDPATGEVLPDGEEGELVITSLTREAMPIIRYRTGDLTRLLPGTARSVRRIQKVTGRTDDMIILRGVNLFPTQIEELILAVAPLAPQFQCVLDRPDRMDRMTVHVERRPTVLGDQDQPAGDSLKKLIKDRIGVAVDIQVVDPGTLERSIGKAKRVIDNRP
jgi:phenylacetate-CoA ligase